MQALMKLKIHFLEAEVKLAYLEKSAYPPILDWSFYADENSKSS